MKGDISIRIVSWSDFEVRKATSDAPEGAFEGYANRFGVRDSYDTEWAPGSWTAGGLREDQPFPFLWMHNRDVPPLGVFKAREDNNGLFIAGMFDPTPEGIAARQRAQSGSAPELSVGFRENEDAVEGVFRNTTLKETSQITLGFASSPGAILTAVRARYAPETAVATQMAAVPTTPPDPEDRQRVIDARRKFLAARLRLS